VANGKMNREESKSLSSYISDDDEMMMGKNRSWLSAGLLGSASDISHRTDRVESRSTTFLAPNLHSCSPARVPLLSCRREVRVDQFITFDQNLIVISFGPWNLSPHLFKDDSLIVHTSTE
jgi:hypothetical protein